jgi:uncharacterized protein YbaR (Trm112 family)
MLKKELLEVLACPECKGRLSAENPEFLCCARCEVSYPVLNDVPLLLRENAVKQGEVK